LLRLLAGLDRQVFSLVPTPSISLVVVDNSPAGDALAACEARTAVWPVRYLHEPRPGISHARNTALSAVPERTDFIAMIDDDEVPADDWLDQLLHAQIRSGADIVVGPALPRFSEGTPDWVAATSFFIKPKNLQALRDLDADPPAATCNVLVRASLLGTSGIGFDPALALSGGEDKLLFQALKMRGYRFAWTAQAQVREWIPPQRATLSYMWRESWRRGSVKFYIKKSLKSGSALRSLRMAVRMSALSLVLAVWDLLRMTINLGRGRSVWVPFALSIADKLGTVAGVLRVPNRHYRSGDIEC
jgi:glycosyltransferase involved in cell wall biosynthesis